MDDKVVDQFTVIIVLRIQGCITKCMDDELENGIKSVL